jgi:hypothetical protein
MTPSIRQRTSSVTVIYPQNTSGRYLANQLGSFLRESMNLLPTKNVKQTIEALITPLLQPQQTELNRFNQHLLARADIEFSA